MDIKLTSNHKKRIITTAICLILLTAVALAFFPIINERAYAKLEEWETETQEEYQEINTTLLQEIYQGSYVLYAEMMQRQGEQTAAEVYMEVSDDSDPSYVQEISDGFNTEFEMISDDFEGYRPGIDYCIILEDGKYEKNTNQQLETVLSGTAGNEKIKRLKEYYSTYFVIKYDESGVLSVENIYDADINEDVIIKTLGQFDRQDLVWEELKWRFEGYDEIYDLKKPENFTVVFGIPCTAERQLVQGIYAEEYPYHADYWIMTDVYSGQGAALLYWSMLVVIAALVFVMTSKKIWKTEMDFQRPKKCYLMEAAGAAVLCMLCMTDSFCELIWRCDFALSYEQLWTNLTKGSAFAAIAGSLGMGVAVFSLYAIWYLSLCFIRPVFALGLREYVKQYSLFYQILPWLRSKLEKLKREVEHIDFSEKSTKTILKVVAVNFVIMAICAMTWFFGIVLLVGYSVALFFIIKEYFDKTQKNYQALLSGVNRIAEGDLDTEITEDLGVFEPFKEELGKVRYGFKKAVDEEVKSQRMKTELVTNVSHDLKTPLTAITTYVELLKKEDITEEERRSYIDTLEKKSLRLKVLIEDLFEVSKATSQNMTLNMMEVDVVNLLKQVSVEHADKFEEMGLDLRWNVPKEKVLVELDNQKAYRIFENLFVNVQKYAMPKSRVYVDVQRQPRIASGTNRQQGVAEISSTGQQYGSAAKDVTEQRHGSVARDVTGQQYGSTVISGAGNQPDMIEITIKNMSADALNFRADEITERFVRGDASRNTEGSGLGLAIAKSFTEAMGGKFRVEVDGDLFKAVIQWNGIE